MLTYISSLGFLLKDPSFTMLYFSLGGYLLTSSIIGYFTGMIAKEKGYNRNIWFVVGFLCGFYALIAMAVIPKRCSIDPIDEKECPECYEIIKEKATKCRYCGHEFTTSVVEEYEKVKNEPGDRSM